MKYSFRLLGKTQYHSEETKFGLKLRRTANATIWIDHNSLFVTFIDKIL